MLRWALLGPGGAAGRVAPAVRACGHDLAVVASRSLTRAQQFAANHGVRRARGAYEEAVEAADVDAVYVALPNDLHEEWATAALEAGKHVLCEKPLAADGAAAARLAAVSASAGRVLMEAAAHRFHPRTQALLDIVRGGEIGAVRLVHAAYAFPMRDAASYRARPEQGGGALLDVGFYAVAAARWLAGEEPNLVRGAQRRWATGVDGCAVALLGFPAGAMATLQASFDSAAYQVLDVVGTQASLRAPRAFDAGPDAEAVLYRDGKELARWRSDPHQLMVAAFADVVAGGAPVLPVDDAVATAEVIDRIRAAE